MDDDFLYDDDDDDDKEEKFSGFSILDESGVDITALKKVVKKIEEDMEETIASPVPQNEQTVIIDNVAADLPNEGEPLLIDLNSGQVSNKNGRVGVFKPAFLQRLRQSRGGQYAKCRMFCIETPVMVKLFFSEQAEDEAVYIEPLPQVEQENNI